MFKVCIIGCGMIADKAHIPAYRHLPEVFKITAVCDFDARNAEVAARRHGIDRFYTNAEEMLEKEKPDIVSVCTPNVFHKQYVLLALSRGCNVMCEKPLALTLADTKEMFTSAKANGVILIACQSMRFTPERLAAKELIDRDGLGEIYFAQFARIRRRGIPTWGRFHIKAHSGGGALIDIGVHMIDAVLWLMGNPDIKSVSVNMSKRLAFEFGGLEQSGALAGEINVARPFDPDEMDVEDFAAGTVKFKGGKTMNFTSAWAANAPEEASIRLLGDKAGLDLPQGTVYRGIDTDTNLEPHPNAYPGQAFPGHFYLTDNFAQVLRGQAELIIKPQETINVAAVLEAAYRSSEQNREIRMEELV